MFKPGICPDPIGKIEDYWTKQVIPIPCKRWSCPHCSSWMKKRILDRISLGFGRDSRQYFFFSLSDHKHPEDISIHLNQLFTNLKKKWKIDKYFWVKEFTPPSHDYIDRKGNLRRSVGGVKHVHGLISFIEKSPVKEEFRAMWLTANGDSYEIDYTEVNTYSPAGYMLKYITKSFQSELFGKNENRYMFSRNFPKLDKFKASSSFQFSPLDDEDREKIDLEIARRLEEYKQKHFDTDNW